MTFTRRRLVTAAALLPLLPLLPLSRALAHDGHEDEKLLSPDIVLRDPELPAAGNPDGDITIVEYFDYRCPYCKKIHADLLQVAREDGKVRLVFKDWPIFRGVSVDAARMVLASKYQGKYLEAHTALITATGSITEGTLAPLLTKAGIDAERAARDLVTNRAAIDAILARSDAQARAFEFNAVPAFIIGKFRVPGVLDVATFKLAIRDARAAAAKPTK